MTLALRWYLGVGTAAIVVHALLPAAIGRELVYLAIGVAAIGALVVGIRRNRPARVLPWALLGCGVAAWVTGDVIWTVMYALDMEPFPSVADLAYLASYPLLAAGMYHLSRARSPDGDRSAVLDALVAGTTVALIMWAAFIEPTWTASAGALLERLVLVAYPVGDVVLLVQLVYIAGVGMGRSRSLRLLGGAFAATLDRKSVV